MTRLLRLCALVALTGCTGADTVSVYFRIARPFSLAERGLSRPAPADSLAHSCYLLSVTAADIAGNGAYYPSHIDSRCADLGAHSGLNSAGDLEQGVRVDVLAGESRTVRLLGLDGSLVCDESLFEVIGDLPRRFHVLGEMTTPLMEDVILTVPDVYDPQDPRDLMAECASAPQVLSIDPSSGSPSGGAQVTVSGTGFLREPEWVTLGGLNCTNVTVLDSGSLTCETPVGAPGNTVDVGMKNRGGLVSTVQNAFGYTNPLSGFGPWEYVDGGSGDEGVNQDAEQIAGRPHMVPFGGSLWLGYVEEVVSMPKGWVMKFNNDNASPDWDRQDDATPGIGAYTNFLAIELAEVDGTLYGAWVDSGNLYVGRHRPDHTWELLNAGQAVATTSHTPRIIVFDDQLIVGAIQIVSGNDALQLFAFSSATPSLSDEASQIAGNDQFDVGSASITEWDWEVFANELWVTWVDQVSEAPIQLRRYDTDGVWGPRT